MADVLPQTVAPVFGAALRAVSSANTQNDELLRYPAGAGALVVLPIRTVR